MLFNIAATNPGLIIWTGTASTPRDISKHVNFGLTFEVVGAIATDAVFNVMYHDASAGDPCVPGAAQQALTVNICDLTVAGLPEQVTIPAGTAVGTLFVGTLNCRPGKFISLQAVSGTTANVRAVITLDGPMY